MKQKITLYEDRLAVRPDAPEEKSGGGIDLIRVEVKGRGTVVFVGRGKRDAAAGTLVPLDIVVGDVVMYGRFKGGEIVIGGETLMLMRECDIIAVVDEVSLDDVIAKDVSDVTPPPAPVDSEVSESKTDISPIVIDEDDELKSYFPDVISPPPEYPPHIVLRRISIDDNNDHGPKAGSNGSVGC